MEMKISEISSSHGGEYDVQSCLLGYHFTRQYIPEDNSEQNENKLFFLTS
jgi:hypothetical protein